jgi:uncharacterized protein (DUF362 family)/Pyruvate/2-oxoacid:ferredoxin oxidoreductase delta subunit
MTKVAIEKCDSYDLDLVTSKINKMLDNLGGIESIIKKDAKVFIKLNCVGPNPPELGITTHPIFTKAVISIVKKQTNNIIIGDNPATKDITFTLKKCGLYDVIMEENLKIIDGRKQVLITNPNYKLFSSFEVSSEMIDVDVLINLPKLKTHSLTYMTVAQKNLFGTIYGLTKAAWHVRASNPLQFGDALNDLYGAILNSFKDKTILHICDGIIGLEGEGPSTGGSPINSKVMLASLDAVSLDRVAVEVANLDYSKLFVTKIAHEREYGEANLSKIEIVGNQIKDFKDLKFLEPVNQFSSWGLKLLRFRVLRNIVLEHPIIDHSKCIKCKECIKICPPKSMNISNNKFPKAKTLTCIRCWCCGEVCPVGAISKSKRPLLGRLLLKESK